ncbi:alpha-hydroxy acid oxidase [Chitinasiproducens palmae]|uniref:(S)-mandelate dehydrogenase n=1 Tax=Chitinasiproducens palmae TaxID=1770053 RepID=A0A1H2PS84_9BURK|nr:alpha-hydroxy acid oxidase [Chitinasiproducens palmae]SDV49412.1 (S)-mandelate dehydrogenase [Chitinasiproducens palmae]
MIRSNVADYRAAARRFLPRFAFAYLEGGAENEVTLRRNRAAFEALAFEPRVLRDVSALDTRAMLAGRGVAWPAVVGPTGINGIFRQAAEEALACAAHAAGLPFVMSTASTSLLEDVREVSDGDLWLQLYVQQDRRIAENLMARAREARFSTLLLTVDTPVLGQRDDYARTGFAMPVRWTPGLLWDLAMHPRWLASVGAHGQPRLVNLSRSARLAAGIDDVTGTRTHRMDQTLNWRDIAWLRTHWQGRIFLKGIQSARDARTAFGYGVDGVVLSNHGGRQLDGARSPLDILPETVASAPRSAEVLIDGGIQRGSDVAKAVALGAHGVLLGRAPLYGLAAAGRAGVADVLAMLHKELQTCMRLLGCTCIAELGAELLTTHGMPAGQLGVGGVGEVSLAPQASQ